jgi:hypothetical protein
MVTLPDALEVLYPNALAGAWRLTDTGSGPTITYWDVAALGTQPTPETITAVTQQQVDTLRSSRAVSAALQTTFNSLSPSAVSDRVTLRYVLTLLNDVREHVGLPRIMEPAHIAGIQASIQAGAAEPITL